MFSPERFGSRRTSFGVSESCGGDSSRNFIGLKTAFRNTIKESRTPMQKAAHFRFSEPATPSVQSGRGWRPSDLSDPHKRNFLTELTGRIFHLAASGDHEEGERKISLERLFTPATDSGDLTPKRSASKKAFASSSFYRPDHPTIDDQVELAQRISFSLVDENNKMSRGQSMYMKRKKRSMRWIHAGSGEGGEGLEEEHTLKHPPMKPPMKLLMNPKGVQDFHAVQEHYQALMEEAAAVPTSPEVNKIVTEIQSPTGKGAELFAKRKKRMDKFIVDETTVQKAHTNNNRQQQQQQQQQQTLISNDLAVKKSAVEERNRQQQQIMEEFIRSREGSLTLVKSPWQATMETGTPDAAFDDKRQRIKLANTVVEKAENKLAQTPSWLDPPRPIPLMSSNSADVSMTTTPPPPPLHAVPRSMVSPLDSSNKRNSGTFNMAAKGWGTYSNFYSPITFAT